MTFIRIRTTQKFVHAQHRAWPGTGFTLIELLVVMAIIATLIGLLLPAMSHSKRTAQMAKDGTHIRGIHQCWLVFSRDFNDQLPTPGLLRRQPVNGVFEPGRGHENKLLNTTDNLHSACIMANYYSPSLCVGPTEPSGRVAVKEDYNHARYNVVDSADPVYWDDSFEADLDQVSHVSYASPPIAGARQRNRWRATNHESWPILANRGVRNGSLAPNEYNKSVTLQIHGGRREWMGNVCFNDGHVIVSRTFKPEGLVYRDAAQQHDDNIFRSDAPNGGPTSPHGEDAWLVIIANGGLAGSADQIDALACEWD